MHHTVLWSLLGVVSLMCCQRCDNLQQALLKPNEVLFDKNDSPDALAGMELHCAGLQLLSLKYG